MTSDPGVGYEKHRTYGTSSHKNQHTVGVVPWTKAEDDILLRECQKNTPYSPILEMLPGRKSRGALKSRFDILENGPNSLTQIVPWTVGEDNILLEGPRMGISFGQLTPLFTNWRTSNALCSHLRILQNSLKTFVDFMESLAGLAT
jgi:hypothetical protein